MKTYLTTDMINYLDNLLKTKINAGGWNNGKISSAVKSFLIDYQDYPEEYYDDIIEYLDGIDVSPYFLKTWSIELDDSTEIDLPDHHPIFTFKDGSRLLFSPDKNRWLLDDEINEFLRPSVDYYLNKDIREIGVYYHER